MVLDNIMHMGDPSSQKRLLLFNWLTKEKWGCLVNSFIHLDFRQLLNRCENWSVISGWIRIQYTLHWTGLDWIGLYWSVLECRVLYCSLLHCTGVYCTVIKCNALDWIALHCGKLYCTASAQVYNLISLYSTIVACSTGCTTLSHYIAVFKENSNSSGEFFSASLWQTWRQYNALQYPMLSFNCPI